MGCAERMTGRNTSRQPNQPPELYFSPGFIKTRKIMNAFYPQLTGKALLVSDMHLGISDPSLRALDNLKLDNLDLVLRRYFDITMVQDLGDGADSKLLRPELLERLCKNYAQLSSRGMKRLFVLVGNHEGTKREIAPLSPFIIGTRTQENGANLVTDEGIIAPPFFMRGWAGDTLPLPASVTGCRFFSGHLRVKDWLPSGAKGVTLDELADLGYEAIFLGDFHQPVSISHKGCHIHSIGTFGASSWKDTDIQSGYMFVTWDEDTYNIERFIFDSYPVFKKVRVNVGDDLPDLYNNVVRVFLSSPKPIPAGVIDDYKARIASQEPFYFEIHTNDTSIIQDVVHTDADRQIEAEIKQWPSESRTLLGQFFSENKSQQVPINWADWC